MLNVARTADRRARLRVYLNDHLAGAAGGIHLAERCRGSNEGTPLAAFLDTLLVEIREDKATLRGLMDRMDVPVAAPKQALAAAAEVAGRLKLNGQLVGYSPLARLLELEGLSAGVEAKHSLWASLVEVKEVEPAVGALDLDALIDRAARQREGLETQRRAAARAALAEGP